PARAGVRQPAQRSGAGVLQSRELGPGCSVGGRIETDLPDHPQRLGDDGAAHLALADAAVGEDDRDFTDGETALQGSIGQLDLEGVPTGPDAVEIDALQHFAAEALEAAGQVADADAEDGA